MIDRAETRVIAPPGPLRTCIGCRQRVHDSDLLRVVVGAGGAGPAVVRVVPDPRRRTSGRGAWVHPDLACVDLAIRRRAFGRALRVAAPIDPAPVREYVTETVTPQSAPPHTVEQDTTSGTPQEMTSYGHSMKRQQ
jgi:uncharacterized protein